MTKNKSYQYPTKDRSIVEKLSIPNYKGGNILLSKDADIIDKLKYIVCQSILAYHQDKKITLFSMSKIVAVSEEKLYDICRGMIDNFCLGELIIYVKQLGITFVPCYDCGYNILPKLWELAISSLKKSEQKSPKTENVYKNFVSEEHFGQVHC